MRIIEDVEVDDEGKPTSELKGSVYIDFRHTLPEDVMKDIDALVKPHGLQVVLIDVGDGDGYFIRIEKKDKT